MKNKGLKATIVALLIAIAGVFGYQGLEFGGKGWYASSDNILGSSSYLEKLPDQYVFADSTTTATTEEGGIINQEVSTEKLDLVRLNIAAKSAYATNTLSIRAMGSHDSINYFDIMHSSSTPLQSETGNATSSPTVASYVISLVPGTATTSFSYPFDVESFKSMRFVLAGPIDTDDDNAEWTRAWIEAIRVEPITR